MPSRTLWDQVVRLGADLSARMSSQDQAVRNARAATTELSRARVERDAVELYLSDREEQRAAGALEDSADPRLPHQRDGADAAERVGHTGA